VSSYEKLAEEAGLSWPIAEDLNLEEILIGKKQENPKKPLPEWEAVHREMKRKGVTLKLLWEEYKQAHPGGYQYTQFSVKYKAWLGTRNLSMPQIHKAGEKMFVDYAGQTIPVDDPETGRFEAQIFVACLGASQYTYVEASRSQNKEDWLMAHVRAFAYMGGVPEIVVPDNLKSGVARACRYEPDLNPSYQELANHYDVVIVPARVRKPKDKAVVESSVLVVERWMLAKLRDRRFRSLGELNEALHQLLEVYNEKPFQKRPGSRRSEYEEVDRPALKPLPACPYSYAEWKKARANVDYHIEVDRHYYSVPYSYHGKTLDVRISRHIIEAFYKGARIMSHRRLHGRQRFSTTPEHMPMNHRWVAEWNPERFLAWGGEIGEHTRALVADVLSRKSPVQQTYRTCLGILTLAKRYGSQRLERACLRALSYRVTTYRSVKSILDKGLDRLVLDGEPGDEIAETPHEQIRGPAYYTAEEEVTIC
jgi:transposase